MAKFRIYFAPQIGSGTYQDPFRSILNDFIDIKNGDRFSEIDNPNQKKSVCFVLASQETHDAIHADRLINPDRIVYLSPLAVTLAEHKEFLNKPVSDFGPAFKTKVKSIAENLEITISDIDSSTTIKAILKKIFKKSLDRQRELSSLPPLTSYNFKFAEEVF